MSFPLSLPRQRLLVLCTYGAISLFSGACAYVAGDYRRKGGKHELLINLENKLGCPTQFELMTQETRYLCTAIHECDFICWGNVTYRASDAKSRLCCLIRVILQERLSKMRSRHTMSAGNEEETRSLSTSSKSSDQLLDGDFNSYGTNQDRHQRGPEIRILKVRHSIVKLRERVYLAITTSLHICCTAQTR